MPTRRQVLFGALAVSILPTSLAIDVGYTYVRPESYLRKLFYRHLGWMRIDPKVVDDWVTLHNTSSLKIAALRGFEHLHRIGLHGPQWVEGRVENKEGYFITEFLLATDFFQNGADQEREVQWQGMWNPLRRPNQNPFARFDDDE